MDSLNSTLPTKQDNSVQLPPTTPDKYGSIAKIAKWMDDYYIDPLLSLLPGGIGDAVSQVLTLPILYVAIFKVRSASLALAILYNSLRDFLIGLIPVLGDAFDFFNKSYKKNWQLLSGFIRNDEAVVANVKSNAKKSLLLIALLIFLIVLTVNLLGLAWSWFFGLFDSQS